MKEPSNSHHRHCFRWWRTLAIVTTRLGRKALLSSDETPHLCCIHRFNAVACCLQRIQMQLWSTEGSWVLPPLVTQLFRKAPLDWVVALCCMTGFDISVIQGKEACIQTHLGRDVCVCVCVCVAFWELKPKHALIKCLTARISVNDKQETYVC